MNDRDRIATVLLPLRLGVFLVMLMWTLDKFVNPQHSAGVFGHFYLMEGLESGTFVVIGGVELAIIIAFVLGMWKRYTYGIVLMLHAISTLSSYRQYLDPFSNMLFWAAWPMLSACIALYLMRDQDTLWTIGRRTPDALT